MISIFSIASFNFQPLVYVGVNWRRSNLHLTLCQQNFGLFLPLTPIHLYRRIPYLVLLRTVHGVVLAPCPTRGGPNTLLSHIGRITITGSLG